MPILGVIASSTRQGQSTDASAMYALGMVQVGAGGATYLTFTGIPATYKHLQLRLLTTAPDGSTEGYVEYNADYTASNYRWHRFFGNGSATASGSGADSYIFNGWQVGLAGSFVTSIIDIVDYASTSKLKTTRCLTGFETNGGANSSWIANNSTLWNNTAAISQIRVRMSTGNFGQYTQATLYGIK